MSNGVEVDDQTFESLTDKEQNRAIFQAIVATNNNLCKQKIACDNRFKIIEKRKWRDKGIAGVAGLVGGYIASFTRRLS